jgi:hypothetical protein
MSDKRRSEYLAGRISVKKSILSISTALNHNVSLETDRWPEFKIFGNYLIIAVII